VNTGPTPTRREELASTLTHFGGVVLSMVALGVLLLIGLNHGGLIRLASFAVYGLSLVFVYTMSTLYHYSEIPKKKRTYRLLDHIAVYGLIAGTFTPIAMAMEGLVAQGVFAGMWTCAAVGVLYKTVLLGRFQYLSTGLYVAMGWAGVLVYQPALDALGWPGLLWLLAGGITYTAGVVFYWLESMPYNHAVWHLFVLGGSGCHFIAITAYLPA
jgi:hemolysin III